MPAEPSSVAPPRSLDLTALGEALSDPAEPGQGAQDAEPFSFGDDNEDVGRPTVPHSNASAAGVKEEAGASRMEPQATYKDMPSQPTAAAQFPDSSAAAPTPAPALPANPDVENLKNLFPDMEDDVIQAVLSSQSDLDSAVTTLLQMSDPAFSAPASTALSQSDSDAALARSLAAEQDRLASRGGGPFMGALPAQQQPTYDPTRLTYAPRVRRVPPTSPSTQFTSTQSRNSSQSQQQQQQHDSTQSIFPKWPGPDEAKAWQDDINKFAENGMAKAASTFSALRARATAIASQSPSQSSQDSGGAQQRQSPSSASGSGGGSFLSSLGLGGASTRANAGYDRDPSPVGEDELARILARGGRSPSGRQDDHDGPSLPPKVDRNSAAAFAGSRGRAVQDRYGALAGDGARRGSAQAARDRAQARSDASAGRADDDDDDDLGWGAAARTGDSAPAKSAKHTPPGQSQAASTAKSQDSISRMDSAAGRGISRGSAPTSPAIAGAATVGGASAAALTAPSQSDDEDDLEYVSNPFEEED